MIQALIKHGDFSEPRLEYGWKISEPQTGFHSAAFEMDCDDVAMFPVKEDDVSSYFTPHFGTACRMYVAERPTIEDKAGVYVASIRAIGATDTGYTHYEQRSETRTIVASQQIGTSTEYQTRSARLEMPVIDMHYFTTSAPTSSVGDTITQPISMPVPDPPEWATLTSESWKISDRKSQFAGVQIVGTARVPSLYYVCDTIRYTPVYEVPPTESP